MDHVLSVTNKLNKIMTICTAVFAVLCCILMFIFKCNESYFDSHGRIGNLAEIEQQALEQENSRLQTIKRNVAVTFSDQKEGKMVIPLTERVLPEQVEVKEEFIRNKFMITIRNGQNAISQKQEVQIDSSIMEALGIFRQKEDLVAEIFCKDSFAYEIKVTDSELILQLTPVKEKYEDIILVYIPYEQKNRMFSEEWQKEIKTLAEDKSCKIYLCSELLETYSEEEVVDFANKLRMSAILMFEVDSMITNLPARVSCNPTYFIPNFGNVELAQMMAAQVQKDFGFEAIPVGLCTEEEVMLQESRIPCAKAELMIQESNRTIEEDYTFNHNLMETVTKTVTQILESQESTVAKK